MVVKSIFQSLVFTCIVVLAIVCVYGCNYELAEGDDQINLFLFKYYRLGWEQIKPTVLHYYYYLFPRLYAFYDKVPWYSIFMSLTFVVVCYFLIEVFQHFLDKNRKQNGFLIKGGILLFVACLLSEYVASFTFTRLSILGMFVSWFYLLTKYPALGGKRWFVIQALISGLIFCICVTLRVESIFLFAVLFPVVYCLKLFSPQALKITGFVFFVLGIALFLFEKSYLKSDPFYEKEKYLTNIADARFVRDWKGEMTPREKMKKEAAITWFTYDDSISVAFLKKLTVSSIFSSEKILFTKNFEKFGFYVRYLDGIGGWYLVVILIVVCVAIQVHLRLALKFILAFLYLLAFFGVLSFFYKNEARVFSPTLSILIFLFVFKLIDKQPVLNNLRGIILMVAGFLMLGWHLDIFASYRNEIEDFKKKQKLYSGYVSSIVNGKTLVISMDKSYLLYVPPFDPSIPRMKILFLDNPYLGLTEQFGTSSNDAFIKGYNLLLKNKERYVFLISDERAGFLSTYLKLVHNVDFKFQHLPHSFQNDGFLTFHTLQ